MSQTKEKEKAMCEKRILKSSKGKVVEAVFNDDEAIDICRDGKDEFANDLAAKFEKHGRLSDDQWVWVHVKANKLAAVGEPDTNDSGIKVDAKPLLDMFDRVVGGGKLKYPKLHMLDIESGMQIVFALAGAASKVPGSVGVMSEGKYGERSWFGRILRDGLFRPANDCPECMKKFVVLFAADPVSVAKQHGASTGHCCFCNALLSDERSKIVGYGKTCASNWGMPWGESPVEKITAS